VLIVCFSVFFLLVQIGAKIVTKRPKIRLKQSEISIKLIMPVTGKNLQKIIRKITLNSPDTTQRLVKSVKIR
jgi:hypothetical protein